MEMHLSYAPHLKGMSHIGRSRWHRVVPGDWDRAVRNIDDLEKQQALRRRFLDGIPWSETGLFELLERRIRKDGVADHCRTKQDIIDRYRRVDALYEQAKTEGRLRTCVERDPRAEGERLGVRVLLDRDGRFIFQGRGHHRLAIARALKLRSMPVGLIVAHPHAVRDGHLDRLRRERAETLRRLNLALPRSGLGLRLDPISYAIALKALCRA